MRRRTLVIVSFAKTIGGGEVYLKRLAAILVETQDVLVFCTSRKLNGQLKHRGMPTFLFPSQLPFSGLLQYPAAFFVCLGLALRGQLLGIHLNGFEPAILAVPARLCGFRVSLTSHITLRPRATAIQRMFRHRRYLLSLRFVQRIVCVSETVAEELRLLLPSKELHVIPNWTDTETSTVQRQDIHSPARILFAGRLVRYKGLHLLLEALRGLDGFCLTVVGDGSERTHLQAIAEGLPVHFAGYHEDLDAFYQNADILVNPSLGPEGSSLVALEAMAHGVACVMSDLPVFLEVSNFGKAASIFENGSSNDLRRALRELLHDRERLLTLREEGLLLTKTTNSVHTATERYRLFFLAGTRRPGLGSDRGDGNV